jgi:hypothetical protein
VPRSLQPLSGAARTSVLRPLGQLSGSLHGPRNDWPAPERQRPYQILKAPADGAGRPGNNRFHRGAAGGGGGVGAAWQDKDPPGLRFLAPEILKPRRTQFCVAHRVLNVFVAQVGLQRPSVVPSVRQCVTAGVPKDVRVNFVGEAGALADAFDKPINGVRREWSASLSLEDVAAALYVLSAL